MIGQHCQFESNGEQINFTATNDNGERIPNRGGLSFGGMIGSGDLSCASSHGFAAQNGLHTMHMDVMDAPYIRYTALSGEPDEHGDDDFADLFEYLKSVP